MSRIAVVDHRNANVQQKPLLDAAQAQVGTLPIKASHLEPDVPQADAGGR